MTVDTGIPREPACHNHARELLRSHKVYAKTVVRVNADSVLYTNHSDQPMIAWLGLSDDGKQQRVWTEAGFPAWPDTT